jgi:hypothetical protein
MWWIFKVANGVIAFMIAFVVFQWLHYMPGRNSEWGPFTLPFVLAMLISLFGIGAIGFLTPDVIARNLYKLEQPLELQFNLRTLFIAMTAIALLLGIIAFYLGVLRFHSALHAILIAAVLPVVVWGTFAILVRERP